MTTNNHRAGRKRKMLNPAQLLQVRLEVSFAHALLRTWGAVAGHYSISKAAAHRIANDEFYRPSQGTIDKILAAPRPVPALVQVPPCPDCGSVHTGRCNGRPVAHVVTLAPGEVIKAARKPRQDPPAWVREATRNLQTLLDAKEKRNGRGT